MLPPTMPSQYPIPNSGEIRLWSLITQPNMIKSVSRQYHCNAFPLRCSGDVGRCGAALACPSGMLITDSFTLRTYVAWRCPKDQPFFQ